MLNSNEYRFKGFEISEKATAKYDAILKHKVTGKIKKVPFGDRNYQHYKDKSLGFYSHLDHNDPKRKASYRKRHVGENDNKYSAGYFAWKYLWT
jgi:hypothetical protein